MRMTVWVKMTALFTLLAGLSVAGVKYVAVVETETDSRSGASASLTPAEVALITTELRRSAVNNLPRKAYNVMTTETVYAQGGAVLEECADENCVITLGSKIGADYIVRGTISKFQTKLTLSVEIYETENGTLVASSDPVRSEKPAELLEMATAACANMYKKFVNARSSLPQSKTGGATSAENKPEINNSYDDDTNIVAIDYYFAAKYEIPWRKGTPVSWGSAYIEGGLVWGNGAFFGIDIGGGSGNERYSDNDYILGFGLCFGNAFNFGHRLQLVYGGTVGVWISEYNKDDQGNAEGGYYNFFGPIVKLRWYSVELTYKGLAGKYEHNGDSGFGYNLHQLMIGFYFATSKRTR
jgi:hypothetical protein